MIVNKLSEVMGRKRLKIKDVVEKSGLSRNTITDLYYDKSIMIMLETLDRLCKALDCQSLSEILEYVPDQPS